MLIADLVSIIQWWFLFFLIGLIFLPLTSLFFSNFFDKGYIFSKIIGTLFISYIVFILGVVKILPFTLPTIFLVVGFLIAINVLILKKYHGLTIKQFNNETMRLFLFEELLFLITLTFWSFIKAHQPDIHGLEKYMDLGFVNSILRSQYFPPLDMWFTPFSINYYYFGHLVTAVLTKISFLPSTITFNLMIATIFAFTFTCSFSIGANLFYKIDLKLNAKRYTLIAGLLTGFLVTLAGNLHTIYTFFKPYLNDNPVPFWQLAFSPNTFPNSYWYPNSTRFIFNTIHEFPIYSFVVSDLHGHVLDIPFVLLTIALLLNILLSKSLTISKAILLSFMLAVMYMTNAWDGIIYALLTLLVFVYLAYQSKNYTPYTICYTLMIIGFVFFSLPFSLYFKPFVSGIGVLCAPPFLTNIGHVGPFLFESDHCQRSPLWQLFILYGFFYFWVISFIVFLQRNVILKSKNDMAKSDIFVLLLILLSTILIIIPEFIYVKDIYPAHYRANTMFKLVYQSFIILSVASGYIILRIVLSIRYYVLSKNRTKKILNTCYLILATGLLFLIVSYPYFAITSYYGNLQTYYGLNGTTYLNKLYPADYSAIVWLNKNIRGQPVILEAQGDSYTDYARVSTHTGLPTVLGWTVHEWLWRGTYDIPSPRIDEIKMLYESEDVDATRKLIDKYHISLVFIGELERQKYPLLNRGKFQNLGKLIYQNNQTEIYQILR